ncbi:MAG: helix-turn-helix transcriptional regulator, partial [Clostridiales bacterium]|nr:helix-turn-helix transcriptional regulator [Clostridiales bacterium]
LFSRNGYAAITTKEIAKKAGVSEVTLFRHFENKRNLFKTIIKEQMHSFDLVSFINNEATYDARKDLLFMADKIILGYKKNSDLVRMMIKDAIFNSETSKHTQKKESADLNAVRKYFISLKEKGIIKDDPHKLMVFFMTNINGFALRNYIIRHHHGGTNEEDDLIWLVNKVIDTILM